VRGLTDDAQLRDFAECLVRRFTRFAFPNEFVRAISNIQMHIKTKHKKETDEGDALRSMREIRVSATPGWDSSNPHIEFLFVRGDSGPSEDKVRETVTKLMRKFQATGQFREPTFRIVTLEEMSAAAYLASDRLDLDYLSHAST
jgi:hypothetical protein